MAHKALTQDMTDEEFDRHIIGILARELGPGGFARYLALNRSGPGDYTAERQQWVDHLTLDVIERFDRDIQSATPAIVRPLNTRPGLIVILPQSGGSAFCPNFTSSLV